MPMINGIKFACNSCIKGHRSSHCNHVERPLFEIRRKGRPVTQCAFCRDLRKTKQVHVKCVCSERKAEPLPSRANSSNSNNSNNSSSGLAATQTTHAMSPAVTVYNQYALDPPVVPPTTTSITNNSMHTTPPPPPPPGVQSPCSSCGGSPTADHAGCYRPSSPMQQDAPFSWAWISPQPSHMTLPNQDVNLGFVFHKPSVSIASPKSSSSPRRSSGSLSKPTRFFSPLTPEFHQRAAVVPSSSTSLELGHRCHSSNSSTRSHLSSTAVPTSSSGTMSTASHQQHQQQQQEMLMQQQQQAQAEAQVQVQAQAQQQHQQQQQHAAVAAAVAAFSPAVSSSSSSTSLLSEFPSLDVPLDLDAALAQMDHDLTEAVIKSPSPSPPSVDMPSSSPRSSSHGPAQPSSSSSSSMPQTEAIMRELAMCNPDELTALLSNLLSTKLQQHQQQQQQQQQQQHQTNVTSVPLSSTSSSSSPDPLLAAAYHHHQQQQQQQQQHHHIQPHPLPMYSDRAVCCSHHQQHVCHNNAPTDYDDRTESVVITITPLVKQQRHGNNPLLQQPPQQQQNTMTRVVTCSCGSSCACPGCLVHPGNSFLSNLDPFAGFQQQQHLTSPASSSCGSDDE